jgi:hypothetical protein
LELEDIELKRANGIEIVEEGIGDDWMTQVSGKKAYKSKSST